MTPDDDTVELIPRSALIDLARLGRMMRKLQGEYFRKRKSVPHDPAIAELRAARQAESKFDAAVADVLDRQQHSLPGMGGGDS